MTRDDAEEAIKALARAIDALSADPPNVTIATGEIADAFEIVQRVANPYADRGLRPGLNKPTESAAP